MATSDTYMRPAEVAELLGLSTKTVARWALEGTVPAAKIAGSWFFRRSVIEALLASA